MEDLKKTFTAGLTVLLILLVAPYYLQWIGYTEELGVEDAPALIVESEPQDIFNLPPQQETLNTQPYENLSVILSKYGFVFHSSLIGLTVSIWELKTIDLRLPL